MFWLITETGTYQKTYVVQSSRPLEKPESLVDGSFCIDLPEGTKLVGKLTYTSKLLDEKEVLDFSVRKAIGLLSSIEDLEPIEKPKRTRKRPEQAEQLEKPVQNVAPKPKRPRNKVDWSSVTE
jgi:hypothetical protein